MYRFHVLHVLHVQVLCNACLTCTGGVDIDDTFWHGDCQFHVFDLEWRRVHVPARKMEVLIHAAVLLRQLTTLPMVCLGPSLRVNLPAPSAKLNCGVT